ncbi:hypothetical protein SELMODRAFT_159799 [Selaginella moellendorffii]|uniref:Cupin type-1 domain-containing protein n=1 Tax=Selaginella moellendorffii TaxID=88036 RepID=D8SZZ4_SELML|nr:legumin A [Selaginella moellendorffii]EFJ09931.1 hypothetical protein SELMODRAFT_159799 [Selaginella moellendorffii]|eukprot:XP_002988902.1 legumin A [Selaginella moellendorffii]
MKAFVCLLLLALFVGQSVAGREDDRRDDKDRRRKFEDLKLGDPREIFRSEGGRIHEWDPRSNPAMCDAEIGARKLILETNGLAVPFYKDSPVLSIIVRGSAKVGVINPLADKIIDRSTVFHVRAGDAIALPRGTASWIFNDGQERTEVLEVAETRNSAQCGRFKVFLLAGGKKENYASVLHGFSKQILSHAFDVEEQIVDSMLEGNGVAIIKVDEKRKMSLPGNTHSNNIFIDYVYRWSHLQPDVRVRDAGELRLLNSFKLPILKKLNMGAAYLKMEAGALTAPGWIQNAHKVMYVERGDGRVQVARDSGEQALDEPVQEGSLVIVPANHPSAKLAGKQGLNYYSIFTNDQPIESYMAGRNSVYRGIPRQVLSSAFQIDEKTQQQLEDARSEDAYIFPPRKESQPKRHGQSILDTLVGAF